MKLVPGYGLLGETEIFWWLSLPSGALIHWHQFLGRLESMIGAYDPGLDFEANPVANIDRDIEREDRDFINELCGNRVSLGLDILDEEVSEDMRELRIDKPGPGIDKVSILEQEDVLDSANLRAAQQSEALRALEGAPVLVRYSGRLIPQERDLSALGWLLLQHRRFVRVNDEIWVDAHRRDCRKTAPSDEDMRPSRNQVAWDKNHGRDFQVSNTYSDRAWRLFEACGPNIAPPKYWDKKRKCLQDHDLHASENSREYDYNLAYNTAVGKESRTPRTNTNPRLPRKCFVEWITWPDMCVFGDIKDVIRAWLRDLMSKPLDVREHTVLVDGRRLKPDSEGNAIVQVPAILWKVALAEKHPELARAHRLMIEHVQDTAIREEDDEKRHWRRLTFAWSQVRDLMQEELSASGFAKLMAFATASDNVPHVVFTGKPLDEVVEQCRNWRGFYTNVRAATGEAYVNTPARTDIQVQDAPGRELGLRIGAR